MELLYIFFFGSNIALGFIESRFCQHFSPLKLNNEIYSYKIGELNHEAQIFSDSMGPNHYIFCWLVYRDTRR